MERIQLYNTPSIQQASNVTRKQQAEKSTSFAEVLKNALNHVNQLQHEANVKRELLTYGQIDDLHDVMITAQKAAITIEATVQIQQKVIDAYNEMMRMQL